MAAFSKPDVGNAVKYLVLSAAAATDGALALSQVPCKARSIKVLNGLKLVVTGVGWLTFSGEIEPGLEHKCAHGTHGDCVLSGWLMARDHCRVLIPHQELKCHIGSTVPWREVGVLHSEETPSPSGGADT